MERIKVMVAEFTFWVVFAVLLSTVLRWVFGDFWGSFFSAVIWSTWLSYDLMKWRLNARTRETPTEGS